MWIYIWDSEIKKIYIWEWSWDDYSAMQWPCNTGFHVPMPSERQAVLDDLTALWYTTDAQKWIILSYYLKIPVAWGRDYTGTVSHDNNWYYRCCKSTNSNRVYRFGSTTGFFNYYKWYWYSIRPFKDIPVIPDSSWTVEYQWTWNAGIFSNATLWLVSISGDWANWITIADKNVWATTVYSYLNSLSEANCGKYFQRGNNNWFAWDWSVTTSSSTVDASSYWPWNYYNSSTFITQQSWDSSNNNDLWWGVTWITKKWNVIEVYQGTTKIRPV